MWTRVTCLRASLAMKSQAPLGGLKLPNGGVGGSVDLCRTEEGEHVTIGIAGLAEGLAAFLFQGLAAGLDAFGGNYELYGAGRGRDGAAEVFAENQLDAARVAEGPTGGGRTDRLCDWFHGEFCRQRNTSEEGAGSFRREES